MFLTAHTDFRNLEEEEEEEEDAQIDDALLGELDDDAALLDEEVDPLVKAMLPDPLIPEEETEKDEDGKLLDLDGEDDEEDMDYDSFDDHDEL